jgi:hypothetical protein
MTRLRRRVSLLAALSLLTWTATAYAECAWVLWVKRTHVNFKPGTVQSDGWETVSAAPAHAACLDAARQRAERLTKDTANLRSVESNELIGGGYVTKWNYAGNESMLSASWEFRCLPDTVDPRGPRGK